MKQNFTLGQLFGLGKGAGLSADETKEMAYSLTGKDSLKKLSQGELNEVCWELIGRKDGQQQREGRATDPQLHKIVELENALGWTGQPERLQGFLTKYYKVPTPMWLTPSQASRCIESLKALARKGA